MAMLAAGSVADIEDPLRVHGELLGGAFELLLLVGISFALPGDEYAVLLQEGGGELGKG